MTFSYFDRRVNLVNFYQFDASEPAAVAKQNMVLVIPYHPWDWYILGKYTVRLMDASWVWVFTFSFQLAQVTVMPRKWAGNGLLGQDLSILRMFLLCLNFMDLSQQNDS